MVLNLNNFSAIIRLATHPEQLWDMLVLCREVAMRWANGLDEQTSFKDANEEELRAAFDRAVKKLLIRWGQLQSQLGNNVVRD